MIELNEYTIWIESDEPTRSAFLSVIEDVAKEADTVVFMPHITLLGGIQGEESVLIQKLHQLAETQSQFPVSLTEVQSGEAFYKSVFINAEHSEPLLALRSKAEEIFTIKGEYQPHMSLLYGEIPAETKSIVQEKIAALQLPHSYPAVALSLWHAQGTADKWKKVAEVPLIKSS